MLIALSSSGQASNATLDRHFGRCSYFAFYHKETKEWSFEVNPGAGETSGAGIKAAQHLVDLGADVILTGEVGPKAWQVLEAAPLEVYQLTEVTLEEAVNHYLEGKTRKMDGEKGGSFSSAANSPNSSPVRPNGRLAVATEQNQVAQHFGRCEGYTLVDYEGDRVINKWYLPNPGHQPGFLPRFLGEHGIDCIIAGGMGPRAQNLFNEQGIDYLLGITGPVDDAVKEYIKGAIAGGESLCDHGQHGHHGQCE